MGSENYDLEKVYDEQISPLMAQIIEICAKHQLPYIASFFCGSDEEGCQQCTSLLNPEHRHQDRIEEARRVFYRQYGGILGITVHSPAPTD